MKLLLFFAASFLFLASAFNYLNAQNGTRKFSILVTNANKQTIADADVELIDNFGKELKSKTNKDGIANFDIGPSENYTKGRARVTSSSNRFLCPITIHSRLNLMTIEMPDDMVIMAEDPGDLSVFDIKEPTVNTEVTTDKNIYARANFSLAVPEYGPYKAACDVNPLASVPLYHDRAVESEKTLLDAISESCVSAADEAVNSLVDLTLSTIAIQNKLNAVFNEQTVKSNLESGKLQEDVKKIVTEDGPKIKAAIADAIEKTKALYEGMEKIAAGPQLYVVDCIWEGLLKFYMPDDILKVKKATENFGKAKEAMGEKLTALKARYDDGSRISFKDRKLFTDWSDITENTEKTTAGLKTLVGIASNPRKYFTSFESQAINALQTAEPLIDNVVDNCKIIELDVKVKTGIEAGQAALAAKRKFAAQMAKAEGQWKDRINAISGTTPWYNPADADKLIIPPNDKKPVFVNEFQWDEYVKHHNDRINARKDVARIEELLSKLTALCSRTQSAANIVNQKIEKYEQLYISGCEAADKCDFSNASIIVSQLKALEKTACGHFYPKPFGFIKSENLEKRIIRNKERCKTAVPDEAPFDPSWVSTVLYKVYPDCDNASDPRNTIEDVKVWMYFDERRINATGSSTMFPAGPHTLRIEVEPRDGTATGNSTYLIKRVEWMRCAADVNNEEGSRHSETPNAKEVTMKVNIVRNNDKNHCYKAVIYIDKCGRNK